MGMAAGQARLLSITSRMSDNELRAQLINNDKMRLATKSSQVSEAYVQALNDASLMFTNYDANNNASFQQLTFNALTAYNPYNNQYALSNASGKILVSEKDAYNFKKSNNLEEFLGKYGLKQTTTYWESLPKDGKGEICYPNINGKDIPAGNPENLQKKYEGVEGDPNFPGYETIVSSEYYYNYQEKYTDYDEALTNMLKSVSVKMSEKADELFKDALSLEELKDYIGQMAAGSGDVGNYSAKDEHGGVIYKDYLNHLLEKITNAEAGKEVAEYDKTILQYGKPEEGYILYDETFAIKLDTKDVCVLNEDGTIGSSVATATQAGSNLSFTYTSDDGSSTTVKNIPINDPGESEITVTETTILTDDEKQAKIESTRKSIIAEIKAGIYQLWDPGKFIGKDPEDPLWKAFVEASKALLEELGITEFGETYEDYIKLNDLISLKDLTFEDGTKAKQFGFITDAQTLDNVMNTYGEPKYTWIDTSSIKDSYNENATAKQQWYQNLFERMSKGYTVLKDGLASSPEWIKFAFESGLVTMEQVDSYNNWNTMIYTNCSDITEQTNSAAVAKAEAEYNAAMNKIENKDKMYDLELKNIDTEHNSLQTEYDSIKSAIDKNIERTFKIYS